MNIFKDIEPTEISHFHNECHEYERWPETSPRKIKEDSIWYWVEENHRQNSLLWAEEDKARRIDVPDNEIANNKRNIDRFNQKRNDAIEQIDEHILSRLSSIAVQEDAWLNSETAGSVIDRLSIISLKILNMGVQADRDDISGKEKEHAMIKRDLLKKQRDDLISSLKRLLSDALTGKAYYKIYRQFKMYNDPAMNPYLSGLVK